MLDFQNNDAVEKTKQDVMKLLQIDEKQMEFEVFSQVKANAQKNKLKKKIGGPFPKTEGETNDFTRAEKKKE